MRIALAQMRVRARCPRENLAVVREYLALARMQGARVLFCPEMSVPGYLIGDDWERPSFLSSITESHALLAQHAMSLGMRVVFGSVGVDSFQKGEDGRTRRYNAAFVSIDPHKEESERARSRNSVVAHSNAPVFLEHPLTGLPFFPKTLLPAYREFDDPRHFHCLRRLSLETKIPLENLLAIVDFDGLRSGLSLCEDGWDDDYSVKPMALQVNTQGARALFNLSCSPYTFGKRDKRVRLFSGKAQALKVPLFYVNAVGSQNVGKTLYGFDGGSLAFDAQGSLLYEGGFFREELAVFDIDDSENTQGPTTASLVRVVEVRAPFASHPNIPKAPPSLAAVSTASFASQCPPPTRREAALERLVALENILALTCDAWGIRRVVVGVSGGIDSAVSATLFARVLGPQEVYCVNMPSQYNSALTQNAARVLASRLGCPYAAAPIQASVNLTLAELKRLQFDPASTQNTLNITPLVAENVQARDRSARVLSAVAASLGAVFPCNANKAESTVGYSTLYGDQSGFLAPLADLWKHEVYELAHSYNENVFQREVIPKETLEVVPSAELSETQDVTRGQGDPLVYPYHDALFRSWTEHWERLGPEDVLAHYLDGSLENVLGCEQGLIRRIFPSPSTFVNDLERWWTLYLGMGAFKRVQAPPVVALSRRTFGFDKRECVGPFEWSDAYLALKSKALSQSHNA
jgi:NAD+ synthase (glutamine-hydrolysing)